MWSNCLEIVAILLWKAQECSWGSLKKWQTFFLFVRVEAWNAKNYRQDKFTIYVTLVFEVFQSFNLFKCPGEKFKTFKFEIFGTFWNISDFCKTLFSLFMSFCSDLRVQWLYLISELPLKSPVPRTQSKKCSRHNLVILRWHKIKGVATLL